jgi:hypothetical protein
LVMSVDNMKSVFEKWFQRLWTGMNWFSE